MSYSACFVCNRCNRCCQNASNLALFEWEVDRLKKKDKNADIRPAIIGRVNGTEVILQWALKDSGKGHCCFLKKSKCSIYKDRPLVCQAFPLIKSGLLKGDQEKIIDQECPSCIFPLKAGEELKRAEYSKRMSHAYCETFNAAIRLDAARSWISDLYQFTARKMRGKQTNGDRLERIGLLEFVKSTGLMTEKEIEYEIKQMTSR